MSEWKNGCMRMGEWKNECVGKWAYGEWGAHSINLFNHDLHNDVLVFDVDDGCHGFPLRPHEGGAKDHTQITGLHQVPLRVGGDAGIT